jgi:hypothetical protein
MIIGRIVISKDYGKKIRNEKINEGKFIFSMGNFLDFLSVLSSFHFANGQD